MSKTVLERRWLDTRCELRKASDGRPVLEGYASVFNDRSENLGGFTEEVGSGAFTKTLKDGADVRALLNHDPNYVLGRSTSSTLRLGVDSTGLHYEVDLGEQTYARDLAISLERGDINQSSFGFRTIKDDWAEDEVNPGLLFRTLLEVHLMDVSPVTYPAYANATSGIARSALDSAAESRGLKVGEITPEGLLTIVRASPVVPEAPREVITVRSAVAQSEDDSDPVAVVKALDAVIDEAIDVLDEIGVPAGSPLEQLDALLDAADIIVDRLMSLMGTADPADPDDSGAKPEPEANASTHGVTFRDLPRDSALALFSIMASRK